MLAKFSPDLTCQLRSILLLFLAILIATAGFAVPAQAAAPVVRGVLFYSPTCSHCHKVMTEILPPIQQKYGERLQILNIDVTQNAGYQLYQDAVNALKIQETGVPTLIVGAAVMVGENDIPAKLPGLIESALQGGGLAWPAIPGLEQFVQQASPTQAPQDSTTASTQPGWMYKFNRDPLANSIAVIVLVLMIISLVVVAYLFLQGVRGYQAPVWLIPLLCILGIGVAGYLTYVEVAHVEAVCGPVGNCNSVQTSPYATLFGFLPVGVLGLLGYLAILAAWLANYFGSESVKRVSTLVMWGMAIFGVLFTTYLTFLEPFVIGATCAWCISSALIITTLLWVTTGPAIQSMATEE